jgi:hypothetical protein
MANITWVVEPTAEEKMQAALAKVSKEFTDVIQNYMDTVVRARGYDGILSLCTYATSTNERFAREGQAGVNFRDACWTLGHQLEDEVLAGERGIPTEQELLDLLPVIEW